MTIFNRILLTGAAGALGTILRAGLKPHTRILRLSDINTLGALQPQEEHALCDLANEQAVLAMLHEVDAVVHMGGVSTDAPFAPVLAANIVGVYNLYEGARKQGVKRVVFASSNHAIGFHKQSEVIDAGVPQRPDSNYGVSKAFGENISRFYFDRYGIETVCMRIGSCFPEPKDRRMLITWLSAADLIELVRASLYAPQVGHTIVYGASANQESWWDNRQAAHLGFVPRDSSEPFRAKVEANHLALALEDAARIYQGGGYVKGGPY